MQRHNFFCVKKAIVNLLNLFFCELDNLSEFIPHSIRLLFVYVSTDPIPMFLISIPPPLIFLTICPNSNTKSLKGIVYKMTFIVRPVRISNAAEAMHENFMPLSIVFTTVWPSEFSETMQVTSLILFTFVRGTTRVFEFINAWLLSMDNFSSPSDIVCNLVVMLLIIQIAVSVSLCSFCAEMNRLASLWLPFL